MMLTYAFTIIITTAWLIKIVNFKFQISNFKLIRRTPFDIPIILYLTSHILSTIFSIDVHTSLWGYYSRFHEGLLATISYIILYYAAVSNLNKGDIVRILFYSLASGAIVSLWGAMEHFGASPSCQFITGKFDTACWIQDVKSRVFATLGQPNWMAAYLDVLILASIGFTANIQGFKFQISNFKFSALAGLFFAALLFTRSRSGILGLTVGLGIFTASHLFLNRKSLNLKSLVPKPLLILLVSLTLLILLFGLPFSQIDKFNLENLLSQKSASTVNREPKNTVNPGYIDIGISESGDIRKIVWQGAIKIWQRYPIFGSGVETFAYAYYQDRPVEHNMVSEWDFLYNKAHNEFLNILATTGTVGFLSYLSLLGIFTLWIFRLLTKSQSNHPSQGSNNSILIVALYSAWVSILITNFFGFSVVIVGLFFFLIPAFSIILSQPESESVEISNKSVKITTSQWFFIVFIVFIAFIGLLRLWNMWQADKSFAFGKNLDGISEYAKAFTYLDNAVTQIPDEPTYRDELSYNEAVLAVALFNQATGSAQEKLNTPYGATNITARALAQKAISDSNQTVKQSPNVLQFWKTRTKVFYQLSTIDKQYLLEALNSIQKSASLAPTDAKVHYNLALLLGQSGQIPQAIKVMEKTAQMKPNYSDAYYGLGLYYDSIGQKQKARAQMEYMLRRIGQDDRAKKWLNDNP